MSVLAPERPASAATERRGGLRRGPDRGRRAPWCRARRAEPGPEAFAAGLADGFRSLADPEYHDGQRFVAPGLGLSYGVRRPLLTAVSRGFKAATRHDPLGPLLFVADRLLRDHHPELRWIGFGLLERTLATSPS